MRLILASSSKTRAMLLHRICGNSFEILPPEIDETPLSLEDPKNLSLYGQENNRSTSLIF